MCHEAARERSQARTVVVPRGKREIATPTQSLLAVADRWSYRKVNENLRLIRVKLRAFRLLLAVSGIILLGIVLPAERSGSEPTSHRSWSHPGEVSSIVSFVQRLSSDRE